jgi:hypothetical protein
MAGMRWIVLINIVSLKSALIVGQIIAGLARHTFPLEASQANGGAEQTELRRWRIVALRALQKARAKMKKVLREAGEAVPAADGCAGEAGRRTFKTLPKHCDIVWPRTGRYAGVGQEEIPDLAAWTDHRGASHPARAASGGTVHTCLDRAVLVGPNRAGVQATTVQRIEVAPTEAGGT